MEKNYFFEATLLARMAKSYINFVVLICLLSAYTANAQEKNTVFEKKVDYIERIYFSGENKEGLRKGILVALAELQDKTLTSALAKQITFLVEINAKTSEADNSCEVLDLLSVGIYNIDAVEAAQQGVHMPSDKAKAKSGDALASLNKLNSAASNLSISANNLALSNYLLNKGKYNSFNSGASKVGGAASTISNTAAAAGATGETFKEANNVVKSFFKKKDKPCDNVAKKDIEISEHITLPAKDAVNNTTTATLATNTPIIAAPIPQTDVSTLKKTAEAKITIKSVSAAQLKSIISAIVKISGVTAADSDSFEKNTAVLIVACNMKIAELSDKIIEVCKPLKLQVESYSNANSTADLLLKP